MERWWGGVIAAFLACGEVATTPDASLDASTADVAPDTSPDVAVEAEASIPVSCDAGYYVEVDDDAGDQILDAGCGEAATPEAFVDTCGHKIECVFIVACGSSSIELMAFPPWSGDTAGTIAYPLDAGFTRNGTIHIDDWPDSGGSVAGRYSVLTKDAGLSGTFCVRAR